MKLLRYSCVSLAIVLGYIAIVACGGVPTGPPLTPVNIEQVESFNEPLTDLTPIIETIDKLEAEGAVNIVTLGDSLMAGTNGYELQSVLDDASFDSDITVNDRSYGGTTACDGAGAMWFIVGEAPDLIIASFGTNDAYSLAVEDSLKCWNELVAGALSGGIDIILMSPPISIRSGMTEKSQFFNILQQVYREHLKTGGRVAYIDGYTQSLERLSMLTKEQVEEYFLTDGVHLNNKGGALMGSIIVNGFTEALSE